MLKDVVLQTVGLIQRVEAVFFRRGMLGRMCCYPPVFVLLPDGAIGQGGCIFVLLLFPDTGELHNLASVVMLRGMTCAQGLCNIQDEHWIFVLVQYCAAQAAGWMISTSQAFVGCVVVTLL